MSTVQEAVVPHRNDSIVGPAGLAIGILVALAVAFIVFAGANTTRHAVTQRYHRAPVATQHPTGAASLERFFRAEH